MGKIKDAYRDAIKDIESGLLNGGVMYYSDGTAYSAFCTVGDGYIDDDGKLLTYSNMYEIYYYNHCNGVTIYKSNNVSLHYKCFTVGQTVELFGRKFFARGCRVYEDLELEEILTKLVNRDFLSYKTIAQNKNNYRFLKAMQERLIKVLLYHKQIYWSDKQNKYVDMKYKEYGM